METILNTTINLSQAHFTKPSKPLPRQVLLGGCPAPAYTSGWHRKKKTSSWASGQDLPIMNARVLLPGRWCRPQWPVHESKVISSAPHIAVFHDHGDCLHIDKSSHFASSDTASRTNKNCWSEEYKVFQVIRVLTGLESSMNYQHLADIPLFASADDNRKLQRDILHLFEALRQLMHAPDTPYWRRIWVVQEVALPPEVFIVCEAVVWLSNWKQ